MARLNEGSLNLLLEGIKAPINGTDAANKQYVDDVRQYLDDSDIATVTLTTVGGHYRLTFTRKDTSEFFVDIPISAVPVFDSELDGLVPAPGDTDNTANYYLGGDGRWHLVQSGTVAGSFATHYRRNFTTNNNWQVGDIVAVTDTPDYNTGWRTVAVDASPYNQITAYRVGDTDVTKQDITDYLQVGRRVGPATAQHQDTITAVSAYSNDIDGQGAPGVRLTLRTNYTRDNSPYFSFQDLVFFDDSDFAAGTFLYVGTPNNNGRTADNQWRRVSSDRDFFAITPNANNVTFTDSRGETAILPQFHRGVAGAVPGSPAGSGTRRFLREDGLWSAPPVFGDTETGAVPAPGAALATPGHSLRGDGSWGAVPLPEVLFTNDRDGIVRRSGTNNTDAYYLGGDNQWHHFSGSRQHIGVFDSDSDGLVPHPGAGEADSDWFLAGDGTWRQPSGDMVTYQSVTDAIGDVDSWFGSDTDYGLLQDTDSELVAGTMRLYGIGPDPDPSLSAPSIFRIEARPHTGRHANVMAGMVLGSVIRVTQGNHELVFAASTAPVVTSGVYRFQAASATHYVGTGTFDASSPVTFEFRPAPENPVVPGDFVPGAVRQTDINGGEISPFHMELESTGTANPRERGFVPVSGGTANGAGWAWSELHQPFHLPAAEGINTAAINQVYRIPASGHQARILLQNVSYTSLEAAQHWGFIASEPTPTTVNFDTTALTQWTQISDSADFNSFYISNGTGGWNTSTVVPLIDSGSPTDNGLVWFYRSDSDWGIFQWPAHSLNQGTTNGAVYTNERNLKLVASQGTPSNSMQVGLNISLSPIARNNNVIRQITDPQWYLGADDIWHDGYDFFDRRGQADTVRDELDKLREKLNDGIGLIPRDHSSTPDSDIYAPKEFNSLNISSDGRTMTFAQARPEDSELWSGFDDLFDDLLYNTDGLATLHMQIATLDGNDTDFTYRDIVFESANDGTNQVFSTNDSEFIFQLSNGATFATNNRIFFTDGNGDVIPGTVNNLSTGPGYFRHFYAYRASDDNPNPKVDLTNQIAEIGYNHFAYRNRYNTPTIPVIVTDAEGGVEIELPTLMGMTYTAATNTLAVNELASSSLDAGLGIDPTRLENDSEIAIDRGFIGTGLGIQNIRPTTIQVAATVPLAGDDYTFTMFSPESAQTLYDAIDTDAGPFLMLYNNADTDNALLNHTSTTGIVKTISTANSTNTVRVQFTGGTTTSLRANTTGVTSLVFNGTRVNIGDPQLVNTAQDDDFFTVSSSPVDRITNVDDIRFPGSVVLRNATTNTVADVHTRNVSDHDTDFVWYSGQLVRDTTNNNLYYASNRDEQTVPVNTPLTNTTYWTRVGGGAGNDLWQATASVPNGMINGNDSEIAGPGAIVHGDNSLAVGIRTEVYAANSTAIGQANYIDTEAANSHVVGNRNRTYDTDTVISGSDNVVHARTAHVYGSDNSIGTGSTGASVYGDNNSIGGASLDSLTVGNHNTVGNAAADTIALGSQHVSNSGNSLLLGINNRISDTDAGFSVLIGDDNRTQSSNSVAIGRGIRIDSDSRGEIRLGGNVPGVGIQYPTVDTDLTFTRDNQLVTRGFVNNHSGNRVFTDDTDGLVPAPHLDPADTDSLHQYALRADGHWSEIPNVPGIFTAHQAGLVPPPGDTELIDYYLAADGRWKHRTEIDIIDSDGIVRALESLTSRWDTDNHSIELGTDVRIPATPGTPGSIGTFAEYRVTFSQGAGVTIPLHDNSMMRFYVPKYQGGRRGNNYDSETDYVDVAMTNPNISGYAYPPQNALGVRDVMYALFDPRRYPNQQSPWEGFIELNIAASDSDGVRDRNELVIGVSTELPNNDPGNSGRRGAVSPADFVRSTFQYNGHDEDDWSVSATVYNGNTGSWPSAGTPGTPARDSEILILDQQIPIFGDSDLHTEVWEPGLVPDLGIFRDSEAVLTQSGWQAKYHIDRMDPRDVVEIVDAFGKPSIVNNSFTWNAASRFQLDRIIKDVRIGGNITSDSTFTLILTYNANELPTSIRYYFGPYSGTDTPPAGNLVATKTLNYDSLNRITSIDIT